MWKPAPAIGRVLAACATGTAVASAMVPLCVGADGRVPRVQMLRGSSSWAFHEALVRDMSDWQCSETPALQRQSCGSRKSAIA